MFYSQQHRQISKQEKSKICAVLDYINNDYKCQN